MRYVIRLFLVCAIISALVLLVFLLLLGPMEGCWNVQGMVLCGSDSPWYPAA
jgi:hypothetical protein